MAKAKSELKVGDKVKVVLFDGKSHIDAEVTKIHKAGGLIDVVGAHLGRELEITSCPKDPTGTKADCWLETSEVEVPAAKKDEQPPVK